MPKRKPGESLPELVRRCLDERGWSGREAARQAERLGHRLSYSTVNDLRKGIMRRVTPEVVKAIAAIFDVPENDVRAAADLPPADESTDVLMLRLHGELTPAEKQEAFSMYQEYVRSVKRRRG